MDDTTPTVFITKKTTDYIEFKIKHRTVLWSRIVISCQWITNILKRGSFWVLWSEKLHECEETYAQVIKIWMRAQSTQLSPTSRANKVAVGSADLFSSVRVLLHSD